jgi:hypothetical protein
MDQPYDAIINLGGDCQVEHQLKTNNLREYALPFDYLIAPCISVCRMLTNDFKGFLDKEQLAYKHDNGKYILDTAYDTRMIHDFILTPDFLNDYEQIKEKYMRRIERFRELLATKKKVLFIRKRALKEEAQVLATIIKTLYPHLMYTLAILDGSESAKEAWNIEGVKNFYLSQPVPYVWTGDNEAWKEILRQLHLITD